MNVVMGRVPKRRFIVQNVHLHAVGSVRLISIAQRADPATDQLRWRSDAGLSRRSRLDQRAICAMTVAGLTAIGIEFPLLGEFRPRIPDGNGVLRDPANGGYGQCGPRAVLEA